MQVCERLVRFQLDCGVSCKITPKHQLNPDTVDWRTHCKPWDNKSNLKPLVKCRIMIRIPSNRKLYKLEFMVLERRSPEALDLVRIQRENIMAIDEIA